MTAPKYIVYPFGIDADDLTAIPDAASLDGSMSWQDGFTPPYEYNLLTNPAALPIPRGQMNQLLKDTTENVKQYQDYGTPEWYSGVSYPIYARVRHLDIVYENQVASNTVTPGVDNSWTVISGNPGTPIGGMIDFAGITPPSGFLLCDGSQISRATYSQLYDVITQNQTCTTTNTSTTVTVASTTYLYVGMSVEGTGIPAGTTIATITPSTTITLSAAATASGTVTLKFFMWGNGDGSTTFNAPDFRRKVSVGSGGTGTTTLGNITGEFGGVESANIQLSELAPHSHTLTPQSGIGSYAINTTSVTNSAFANSAGANLGLISSINTNNTPTSQTAFSKLQPSVIVTKIIKY
jgi:microcystin-dependent protein